MKEYPSFPELQVDENGYMKSFSVEEPQEYKEFFDKYGFVVIRDVVTDEDCSISHDEIWESLRAQDEGIDRNEPNTWSEEHWPKTICRRGGFMGKFPYWKRMNNLKKTFVAVQPQAWKNRENVNIYNALSTVLGTKRLWGSIDRYGIMRPTQKELDINEDWSTKEQWLHWDLSPFHFGTSAAGYAPKQDLDVEALCSDYGGLRIQAMINLVDCPITTGGFHCVPGFHHRFFEWRDENINDYGSREEIKRRNFIEVPDDDEMRNHIVRVPMPKRSLLIWNSMLPHGNFPNTSATEFRMVQYVKMIPVEDAREFEPAIRATDFDKSQWFPQDYELTQLGKRLYGVEEWPEEEIDVK